MNLIENCLLHFPNFIRKTTTSGFLKVSRGLHLCLLWEVYYWWLEVFTYHHKSVALIMRPKCWSLQRRSIVSTPGMKHRIIMFFEKLRFCRWNVVFYKMIIRSCTNGCGDIIFILDFWKDLLKAWCWDVWRAPWLIHCWIVLTRVGTSDHPCIIPITMMWLIVTFSLTWRHFSSWRFHTQMPPVSVIYRKQRMHI